MNSRPHRLTFAWQVCTVLFMPTLGLCFSGLLCEINNTCGTTVAPVITGSLGSAVFLILTLCLGGLTFDLDGQQSSRYALARAHSRWEVLNIILQAGLMLLFRLHHVIQSPLLLAVAFTAVQVTMAAVYTWYQPFLVRSIQVTRTVLAWLLAWIGVCLLMTTVLGDQTDRSGAVLLYLATPPLILLTVLLITVRRTQLLKKDSDALNDVFEVTCRISSS